MGKVLMVNVPYSGHTNPTLPLAKELVRRGHEVTYINAEEFRNKIEDTGAIFVPYVNYPDNPTEKEKKSICFRAAYDTLMSLDEKFDLLIYEMFFYPAYKFARIKNIPTVRQFSQPAWTRKYIADSTLFYKINLLMVEDKMMHRANKKHIGLENRNLTMANLNDKPDMNLVYVPSVFQRERRKFGSDYYFTIPPVEQIPTRQKIPYDEMKSPIVYISLGSMISSKGFYQRCVNAFRNTEFSVILNTGRLQPHRLGTLPENIHAYSFVPQLEVLDHADIFITHAGMNSVNEAIARKVPMIAMPFINDQPLNAERIEKLGIGRRLNFFTSSSSEIYNTAKEILADKSIPKRYRFIEKSLEKDSFPAAVDAIENLIAKGGKQ